MLDRTCPFKGFSPLAPRWATDKERSPEIGTGMRLVVYVLNLDGPSRSTSVSDRQIIEEMIRDNFLVVTVDFGGGRLVDHLEFQKDINGLFFAFGGEWPTLQRWYTDNRKSLLEYPGPNTGLSFTFLNHPELSSMVPVNRDCIYVIPSGYTVSAGIAFKENYTSTNRDTLLIDAVYPQKSSTTDKVPVLLEMSSSKSGPFMVNANTPILYSWLFNDYAFAMRVPVVALEKRMPIKRFMGPTTGLCAMPTSMLGLETKSSTLELRELSPASLVHVVPLKRLRRRLNELADH